MRVTFALSPIAFLTIGAFTAAFGAEDSAEVIVPEDFTALNVIEKCSYLFPNNGKKTANANAFSKMGSYFVISEMANNDSGSCGEGYIINSECLLQGILEGANVLACSNNKPVIYSLHGELVYSGTYCYSYWAKASDSLGNEIWEIDSLPADKITPSKKGENERIVFYDSQLSAEPWVVNVDSSGNVINKYVMKVEWTTDSKVIIDLDERNQNFSLFISDSQKTYICSLAGDTLYTIDYSHVYPHEGLYPGRISGPHLLNGDTLISGFEYNQIDTLLREINSYRIVEGSTSDGVFYHYEDNQTTSLSSWAQTRGLFFSVLNNSWGEPHYSKLEMINIRKRERSIIWEVPDSSYISGYSIIDILNTPLCVITTTNLTIYLIGADGTEYGSFTVNANEIFADYDSNNNLFLFVSDEKASLYNVEIIR